MGIESSAVTRALAIGVSLISLTACAGSTSLVPNCCYTGDQTLARLGDVQVVMSDGTQVPYADALAGFQPQTGVFTSAFDIQKTDIARVTYASLVPLMPLYDANTNGWLEDPEIAVMYAREAAIGMGHQADHLAFNGVKVAALATARADIGGLMAFVRGNRNSMTPEARAVFQDLERLGIDQRTQPDQGNGNKFIID